MISEAGVAEAVFFLTLVVTFLAAAIARRRAARSSPANEEDLAGRSLNKWLIGLSAATTGNSGFIVTGAVGLGYAFGIHWLLLPLSWMIGDLVYWSVFPGRLNDVARQGGAVTISEFLTAGLSGVGAKLIAFAVSVLLLIFLGMYTSAQWMAGQKFLSGVFPISDNVALVIFGLTIVAYSSLGGFRGSIYTDVVQAVVRLIGTLVAVVGVAWFALSDWPTFLRNTAAAGPEFFDIFPNGSFLALLGFVAGYALAAIGFGLGQPQIITRYFAGQSAKETIAARWIYIGFLQFTWLAMTGFGILLRGVMPDISDPETGLSVFFVSHMGAMLTGIIFADVFATIASTSNGILVAIAQSVRRDLLAGMLGMQRNFSLLAMTALTSFIGIGTILISFALPGNVFTVAIDAVSKIGAGLAGPVAIKAFGWRHSSSSLLAAILAGIGSGYMWSYFGLSPSFNEAGVGMICSLVMNWLVSRVVRDRGPVSDKATENT